MNYFKTKSRIFYPTSDEEIFSLIDNAINNNIKIKVMGAAASSAGYIAKDNDVLVISLAK